jgi:hypothetical protein
MSDGPAASRTIHHDEGLAKLGLERFGPKSSESVSTSTSRPGADDGHRFSWIAGRVGLRAAAQYQPDAEHGQHCREKSSHQGPPFHAIELRTKSEVATPFSPWPRVNIDERQSIFIGAD